MNRKKAMNKEMDSLIENNNFNAVPLPANKNPVGGGGGDGCIRLNLIQEEIQCTRHVLLLKGIRKYSVQTISIHSLQQRKSQQSE